MSGAPKRSGFNVSMGQKYFCIVIIVISIIGCPSEKSSPDTEDGAMNGFHCKTDSRCLCFEMKSKRYLVKICEEKVLLLRLMNNNEPVYYEMECKMKTELDPYLYLSIFLFANFSTYNYTVKNIAHLKVYNCSAPSSNQSVLFGDWSTGSIGGWRDLPLEKLTIDCQESKTLHFSMHHWGGLEKLKELTIICPKLSMLDEDLFSRVSKRLESLRITDTGIRHLPERFFSDKETLKTLDLRRNKLRSLRRNLLSSMWNLEGLYLGGNEIGNLNDDIFLQTKKLYLLDLENNSLTTLPTSLCRLKELKFLEAGNNRISFIPEECLCSLPSLIRFAFHGNKVLALGLPSVSITTSYNNILSADETLQNSPLMHAQYGNLNNACIAWSSIKDLRLGNNSLSFLPDEALYAMHGLQFLDVSSNRIAHFPEKMFSRNNNLTVLLASNNVFTNIPATLLKNKTRLLILDLSYNLIETLDSDFFSDSSSLCYVHINNNRIRHLPEKIFQPFKTQNGTCVEFVLDMSGNRLEDVPELSIPGLTHLNLSKNHLTLIEPDMLSQAPRLLEVNLSHNFIHTIQNPLELDEHNVLFSKYLVDLQVIDLSSNRLTVHPSIWPVLATLQYFHISGNNITKFAFYPETEVVDSIVLSLKMFYNIKHYHFKVDFRLWKSAKMKHIDLSRNRLDLEECVEYVYSKRLAWGCFSPLIWPPALEVIILSHNRIAYIPMEFQHYLPNLRYVDLSHNKIKRLWYGDLLFTRVRDYMDLEVIGRIEREELWSGYTLDRYPGSRNLTIDLRHNSIASLQLPDDKMEVVIPGCDIDSHFSRVKLLLGHNPFVCDCEVFKLLRYASKEIRPSSALERLNGDRLVVPAIIDIQDLRCSQPVSVKGNAVADVESWAYHWLPMIGFCWNDTGVNSASGHKATSSTEAEGIVEPPA